MRKKIMIKNFKNFNESILRNYDMDTKKKVAITDLKIGDKIKFVKSTSLFRRLMPSFAHKVAGHGEEYFLKNEVYEFVNYWSDFARDSGWDYDETIAMEFECLESPKSNRIGTKFIFSLRHFHEYKEEGKFIVI
jgi:hypothetical protein